MNNHDEECERLGLPPKELARAMKSLGWSREKYLEESAKPDWGSQVMDLYYEQLIIEGVDVVRRLVAPRTFQGMSREELTALCHPKLQAVIGNWSEPCNAVLLGPTGCGKSACALVLCEKGWEHDLRRRNTCISYPFLEKAERPMWVRACDLSVAVQRHPLGQGDPPALENAKRASCLVIDDITWSEKDQTFLELMAFRYDCGIPTIVTCGATRSELLERFGDAMGRRLIETNGQRGVFVDCFESSADATRRVTR